MLLVSRAGDLHNITLAFALVPAEDAESYAWLFDVVCGAGVDLPSVPDFCDRNMALLLIGNQLGLDLGYCTLHIIRNVLAKFPKFNSRHVI